MSRCLQFPPPGYLWNGVGGQLLIELIKLNADMQRKRRKEKRKRRENLETVEQKKKIQANTSLTQEVDNQHGSSGKFEIIQGRNSICMHPNSHDDHGNCARSFCVCSLQYSNIDVDLLPDLSQLEKFMQQALLSKQVDIFRPKDLGCRPVCEFHYPDGKAKVISDNGSLQTESHYRELILNWVPPPLETLNTEFSDEQWLFDREPLRKDKNIKGSSDHFCYPYTTIF